MTSHIKTLNSRFAERLGYPDGIHPRFQWVWAPDTPYMQRTPDGYERNTWASRIGKRWMLSQWRPPEMSREVWSQTFGATLPYPANGQYVPHPETALPFGMEPNSELTEGYIRTLRQQMETSLQDHIEQSEATAQYYQKESERKFYESVADFEPLSWKAGQPETPCTRGGCVSFGGVDA